MNLSRPESLHGARTASGPLHNPRPIIVSCKPIAVPLGRRTVQPAASGNRRPVSRDLLDNVDSSNLGGFSGDGSSATQSNQPPAGPRYHASGVLIDDSILGSGPQTLDATSPSANSWHAHSADSYTWPSSAIQPPDSSPNYPPAQYGTQEYDNTYQPSQYPWVQQNQTSELPQSPAAKTGWPSTASTLEQQYSSPPLGPLRPQTPQPGQPPPHLEPRSQPGDGFVGDWGEPDPLTDWGGDIAGETTGWDNDQERWERVGMGVDADAGDCSWRPSAATARQAAAAAGTDSALSGAAGVDGSEPADSSSSADWYDRAGRNVYGGGSGSMEASVDDSWRQPRVGGVGGADASRTGGTSGPASPYESYDGWAGVRFTQDARYNSGGDTRRSGAGAGPPGPGARQQPPLGLFQPSDIVLLSGRDASGVLPLAPTSGQVDYFQPRTLQERIVQYVGSVGASVILSKAAILAGPALLYPIWSPWIRAGLRNLDLYSKTFACVGLWRAQVLDTQINGLAIGGMLISKEPPVVSMLVGDPWVGGARVALELPYQIRSESIRPGDSVELLVLSRDDRFTSFKVVREAYLPQSGLWLCDYPFLNRDLFLSISIAVEQSRRDMAAAAAASATLERMEAGADVPYYAYDMPTESPPGPGPTADPRAAPGAGAGTLPADGLGWQ